MYRISVTTIEKFRRYLFQASAYDTEESLLQSIKGIFTGNDKTRVGSCCHKIIEQEAHIADGGLIAQADGVQVFFTAEQAAPFVEFKRQHPRMIHEVPASKVYLTSFGPILVTSRIDGVEGRQIQDSKTKFKTPDLREYADSYQWRFYEDMLDVDLFHYDIFEVRGFEALKGAQPYQLPGVQFLDSVRLECARYEHMGDDCRLMLQEFLDYIELRNLWKYLKLADPSIPVTNKSSNNEVPIL